MEIFKKKKKIGLLFARDTEVFEIIRRECVLPTEDDWLIEGKPHLLREGPMTNKEREREAAYNVFS